MNAMENESLVHYDLHHILHEISLCLDNELYFAALSTALILPDICGDILKHKKLKVTSGRAYDEWCNIWLHPYLPSLHISQFGKANWGTVIYKLRCGILHNGEVDVCGKDYQWIKLVEFNFYINGKPWYAEPLSLMSETTSGSLNHSKKFYIDIDIRFLIRAIINAVLAFEKNLELNQDDFPAMDIYIKP